MADPLAVARRSWHNRAMRSWLWLGLVLAACGGKTAAPPAPAPLGAPAPAPTPAPTPDPVQVEPAIADPLPAQVEAMVGGYEAAARAAGPEVACPAAAAAITAAVTASAEPRAAVRAALTTGAGERLDVLLTAAAPRLAAATATLDAVLGRCRREPAVASALDGFAR